MFAEIAIDDQILFRTIECRTIEIVARVAKSACTD
jgi:hypothetical protein